MMFCVIFFSLDHTFSLKLHTIIPWDKSNNSRGKTYEKTIGGTNLSETGKNRAQTLAFCHFLKFGSFVFFEIAYDDTLRQV